MLTPSFEAEQNEKFVILKIRTPYIKVCEFFSATRLLLSINFFPQIGDVEVQIEGNEFKFHCHPYFLWYVDSYR